MRSLLIIIKNALLAELRHVRVVLTVEVFMRLLKARTALVKESFRFLGYLRLVLAPCVLMVGHHLPIHMHCYHPPERCTCSIAPSCAECVLAFDVAACVVQQAAHYIP